MAFDITAQIETWRTQLLDTSGRNRLINFRSGRGGGILLIHPDPGDLWHVLVSQGDALNFPWKRDLIDLPEDEAEPPATDSQDVLERCRCSPRLRADHLLTELPDKRLAAKLTRLALSARDSLTEQGVTTLFVALGFLRWYESADSQTEYRSPLLLVPVRLERDSVDAPWGLQAEDEDILSNHTLAQRLLADFKLRLPTVEDESIDPDDPAWRTGFLAAVEQCVRHQPRWEVLDEAALGTFSFQKLAMWEDLARNQERISSHELCRAIAGDRAVTLRIPADLPAAEELDEKTTPAQTHHILDADSSQHAAIVAATAGASLVLDGPPGTGKSQTIANTIAEFLAAGKTVLFVSEKTAALDVVKRRLDDRGLGDFCLELHSHRTNKHDVVAELGQCLGLTPERQRGVRDDLAELADDRTVLNDYVRALHAVRQPLGLSAFQVHGELARLDRLASVSRCPVSNVLARDAGYLRKMTELLAALPDCRPVIDGAGRHPWRGCRVTVYSPALRDDVRHHCTHLAAQVGRALETTTILHESGLAEADLSTTAWLTSIDNARRVLRSSTWQDPVQRGELQEAVRRWLDAARTARGLRKELRERLASRAFDPDSAAVAARASGYRSFWSRLLPAWWGLRSRVRQWYDQPPRTPALVADLQQLARYHQAVKTCGQLRGEREEEVLRDDAGQPDWERTLTCLLAIERLEPAALRARLTEAVRQADAVRAAGFDESWKYLTDRLFDPAQDVSTSLTLSTTPLGRLRPWLAERAGDAERIREWVRYREVEQALTEAGIRPVLDEVERGQVKIDEAPDAFRVRFLRWWLDELYQQAPDLRQFDADRHERLIDRFRDLDRRAIESAPGRVRNALLARADRPGRDAGAAPESSELGILLREVHKKRRHLPLRKLFAAMPTLLPRLKPCLMMSPLAVSTYLQSPDLSFDLVIFDEASQVRPHDAVCAVWRGRQLLVAGDQKQLPPTSFFERALEDDGLTSDEAEIDDVGLNDYESILDVCCTLGLPRRRLRWHYRSRREGLIAFANHHVYANELVTFPSIDDAGGSPAVEFEHVADGRWKVGAAGGFNAIEARRTAERVLDHCRESPDETLGVIAFSQRQQMRILDELEELRRANPELEEFFRLDRDDPFFVKNLENVQGDERDVIFLSVGYGPDEAGKIAMRFGPLNRQGGERRLNVAVTRARQRMTVISSLRAQDIDLSRTSAVGARLLRAYLDYAERGPEALHAAVTEDGDREFDSPFERDVYEELTRQGLTVHRQVGCSGFRIDLAIMDPRAPSRYLLAVECDGATYHASATARDRDRLRQEVLESLRWHVCRVWSTDWVRDRKAQVQRVLAALEKAKLTEPVVIRPRLPAARPARNNRPPRDADAEPGPREYDSIDQVPDKVLEDEVVSVLRSCGATADSDLIQAASRRLGFKRTGTRIQACVEECIERLTRSGRVGRTVDQRLQVVQPQQAASR